MASAAPAGPVPDGTVAYLPGAWTAEPADHRHRPPRDDHRRPAKVVLNPGDFCFGHAGMRMHTLLGSCVSITLWHPRLRIGGMCHYLLPARRRPAPAHQLDGRYADEALQLFLREVRRHHTRPEEYQVKMVGGGNQFPESGAAGPDIPRDNIAAGLRLLDRHGFVLTGHHLGGAGPRQIIFDLSTGAVWINHRRQASAGAAP